MKKATSASSEARFKWPESVAGKGVSKIAAAVATDSTPGVKEVSTPGVIFLANSLIRSRNLSIVDDSISRAKSVPETEALPEMVIWPEVSGEIILVVSISVSTVGEMIRLERS